eukprot:gene1611-3109_t
MPRSGTLLICTQNLDFSGANQVMLNIVSGTMHEGNVVILSPVMGPFANRFMQCGAAVRTGELLGLLGDIRDVFCIICNTIMTAPIVLEMARRPHPVIWVLHEWWDDKMITENLSIRNLNGMCLETIKDAMGKASKVVCVCEGQKRLYSPSAPSTVIYVGVPQPCQKSIYPKPKPAHRPLTFLSIGIICPRKNQVWAVKLFKMFAGNRKDCVLHIVGARYTRPYEIQYLDMVKKAIDKDERIQLHDVTDDVDSFYDMTDILLFTSVNEVTPMVISEAMSRGIPCIATNIAGIPEMITHGQEGFLVTPDDDEKAVSLMNLLGGDEGLRKSMGLAAMQRFSEQFDLNVMVERYRRVIYEVAPPVVLVDMDGVLVDWDAGFMREWKDRSSVDRSLSYYMERCVDCEYYREAELLVHTQGFFESLPAMRGALAAMQDMVAEGLRVYICTTPVLTSLYCAQEKINWVRTHLGERWLDKLILCADKTSVRGDLLIDDKPRDLMAPRGRHTTATWKQVVFDAPYNRHTTLPRLKCWSDWRTVLQPLLGKRVADDPYRLEYGEPSPVTMHKSRVEFPLQNNGKDVNVHSVEGLLEAFKTLDQGEDLDAGSLTLTDDSESFLEDYQGFKADVEREARERGGLDGLKQSLNSKAKTRQLNADIADRETAIQGEAEDVMDVELFRQSYRRWRMENVNARK